MKTTIVDHDCGFIYSKKKLHEVGATFMNVHKVKGMARNEDLNPWQKNVQAILGLGLRETTQRPTHIFHREGQLPNGLLGQKSRAIKVFIYYNEFWMHM